MKPLPENAVFSIPAAVAGDLVKATQRLPEYAAHEYYDPEIQQHVYNVIRQACSEEFDELIVKLRLQIKKPPFSLLIKGLEFDSHHRLLIALNRAFGLLVARPHEKNTPRAQLIHQIVPGTDKDDAKDDAKAGNAQRAKVSERFHVDGADRPSGLHYVSMQCVHAHEDHSQGRSRLLDSKGFRETLQDGAINQSVINRLETQRVPWKTPAYLGGGVCWAPVLQGDCIRWNRDIINEALKEKDITISSSMVDTLDHIDRLLAEKTPHIFDFRLEPGDFLMMDNRRCLHTRSSINNPESTRRLMLRAWVE
ncbi:hypothetical protein MNBD_GAMMA10-1163 [hydrothermal vent metagenome]|uniref:TauD/TfdA-like domain-containing protein n=1 Tax=hydrothermal vent metagenome TaxID=652676 RepID=A0A3B0XDX6_9ZZZZ